MSAAKRRARKPANTGEILRVLHELADDLKRESATTKRSKKQADDLCDEFNKVNPRTPPPHTGRKG